jgi:hypothetical protein
MNEKRPGRNDHGVSNRPDVLYDRIGRTYVSTRHADPRIAAAILAALDDVETVVNVGAGAGAYEPDDRSVVSVEPSSQMIQQRAAGPAWVIRASAEALPFRDDAFDAGLALLTLHHWSASSSSRSSQATLPTSG